MSMHVIAGFLLIFIGFVILLSTVRMIEHEIKKGKKADKMLWVLFGGIVLFAIASIISGIFFVIYFNQ